MCATVTIDADFDRQIHNNNNNMRAVKRVVYRYRAPHTSIFPGNCIAVTSGDRQRHLPVADRVCAESTTDVCRR